MSVPYASKRRLVSNSLSAMLAGIELYNKPQITYRDEVVVMLAINAWELALKAALRAKNIRIFYPKKPGQPYRSFTLDDCLRRVDAKSIWPAGVDGGGVSANIKSLADYRDRAIHLYNTSGLGSIIYVLLQQSVLNYRDFMFETFSRDLADSITWQLLPLGATAPADTVQFMKVDPKASLNPEVGSFLSALRERMAHVEDSGGDVARVATTYDIHLQSKKRLSSADIAVAVSKNADAQVVHRKIDPNKTYPYNMTELLERVNQKRAGRALNMRDFQAVCWKHDLRDDERYAWRHKHGLSPVWSPDALNLFVKLSDQDADRIREEYSVAQRKKS